MLEEEVGVSWGPKGPTRKVIFEPSIIKIFNLVSKFRICQIDGQTDRWIVEVFFSQQNSTQRQTNVKFGRKMELVASRG